MLTKEEFKEAINILKAYSAFEDKMYKISNGAIELFEVNELQNLQDSYVNLISKAMNLDDSKEYTLDYYLWELNFGKHYTDGCFTENDNAIDISDDEKLYDYLAGE